MKTITLLDITSNVIPPSGALVESVRAALYEPSTTVDVSAVGEAELLGALLAIVPDSLRVHREIGIPTPLTLDTLRDAGSKQRLYGAKSEIDWILGLMRADVVSVGRLQVERRPSELGDHALHVPEAGPLAPSAVDDSLLRAEALLTASAFSCKSWLLDPVLSTELPDTNIAAFAERFVLDPRTTAPSPAGSQSAAKFVFKTSLDDVLDGKVDSQTRLQLLVAEMLRSGRGWAEPTGTIEHRLTRGTSVSLG